MVQAGAVTFVFTDIEASTRRWEADAAGMSAELARHDEVVREALEGTGGEVFKHTGDGMCAAFSSAGAGLAGARAVQEGLAGGPLRVRVGVHSGSAEQRDGDYFGPTLNRTARLMGVAHGGQIVVSAATAELARDDLPRGATLVDLGEHRLADLARAERVFQLDGAGCEGAFPPLRSLSAYRHNLPVALSTFVGRERELGEIGDLLGRSRLVTLAGVGGAGKTRLATEVAARALGSFPDGVFLVELAPLTDPELVPPTVSAALGLILDGPGPLVDQIGDYLNRRRALVVLDNCEHLIDAAAKLSETLLQRAPGLVVLATSREPLGVAGEVVWRIPPLDSRDTFALLCDRARAADPTFAPSEGDSAALARIGARLDGIPLALELAAARLRVLSAEEIAARLDDRFRLLTGGARTAVDRHRTLRAAVDWGYDLLDEPSRALLRSLSVFPSGWDLAAAETVGGATARGRPPNGSDTLDVLAGLVDRSWVVAETTAAGPTRYRLAETIRHYAAEKLADAGEADETRQRHSGHYWQLAKDHGRTVVPGAAFMRTTRVEMDNFRAALEWSESQGDSAACLDLASGLFTYFQFSGREEGRPWLERALAIAPDETDPRAIHALCCLGFLLAAHELGPAEAVARRALDLARSAGDGELEETAKVALGLVLSGRGDSEEAIGVLTSVFEQMLASKVEMALWAAHNLAWAQLARSGPEEATRWFKEVLRLAAGPDDVLPAVHALAGLATLAATGGDAEAARTLTGEAVTRARDLDLPLVLVMALTRSAEVAVRLGTPEEAAPPLCESLNILRDMGTRCWVAESLQLVVVVAAHRDEHALAARLLGAARAVDEATGETGRPEAPGAGATRDRLSAALGPARLAAELASGAAMTLDEALTAALGHLAG